MSAAQVRFCVADVEVLVRSARPDGLDSLSGFYRHYPTRGAEPGLILTVERVAGFARGRQRSAAYPAFERRQVAPHRIALSRFDAEGEIALAPDSGPIRGHFRVGESTNTLEAAIRIGVSIALPRQGGLILHASAIAAGGRVSIFSGVSGAGKSTIAELLAGASPAWIRMSDELVIVKPDHRGVWHAHVTPFIGSHGLPHNTALPVGAIHFLRQAHHHRRVPVARVDAVRELLKHVLVYVAEPVTAARTLAAASALTEKITCYSLEFARDAGVARALGLVRGIA